MKAANILVSLGQIRETLRILHASSNFETAALFLCAVEEYNLLHLLQMEPQPADGSVSTPCMSDMICD